MGLTNGMQCGKNKISKKDQKWEKMKCRETVKAATDQ